MSLLNYDSMFQEIYSKSLKINYSLEEYLATTSQQQVKNQQPFCSDLCANLVQVLIMQKRKSSISVLIRGFFPDSGFIFLRVANQGLTCHILK